MGLYGEDIRDHGADPLNADNWGYISDAIAAAGSSKTLLIPDGVYGTAQSLLVDHEIHLNATSHAAVLLATGAHPCITIDSTNGRVMGGEIKNVQLAATSNAGTSGIKIIGDPENFVALSSIDQVRFSGFDKGIEVAMGHFNHGGWNVSHFSVNKIADCIWGEWGTNKTQYGIFADGANTLTMTGGICRAEKNGIRIGDGSTGFGDILISGVHFNFGEQTIRLEGSTNAADYRHNITVSGNQFDGKNAVNIWARNLEWFRSEPNNYAGMIPNDIQNCHLSQIDFNNFDCHYGVTPRNIGATADLCKVAGGPWGSAVVSFVLHTAVVGRGMHQMDGKVRLRWDSGALTVSGLVIDYSAGSGGSVVNLAVLNVGNEAVFQITHNATLPGSRVDGDFSVSSPRHTFTVL